jgi:hypothetical protein
MISQIKKPLSQSQVASPHRFISIIFNEKQVFYSITFATLVFWR